MENDLCQIQRRKRSDEMMNWFRYLLVALVALSTGPQIVCAQLPTDHDRGLNRPALVGSVESVGGRLRVSLANADGAREFRGVARISLGASDRQTEAARFEFTLAPQESRLFPLDSRGISGDRYTLAVYDRAGSLILLRSAPVKHVIDTAPIVAPSATTAPAPAATAPPGARGLTVKARLAAEQPRRPQGSEIEAPVSDETGPVVLSFEVIAPAPIINASFSVSTSGFAERKAITVRDSANLEFKLPDDFNEQKISYALTGASGRTLARGEVKLEELKLEDSVSVSEVKFDQVSYAPGESAHLVMTLEGHSPYGYRLEVTAKHGEETILLRDSRRGVFHEGRSIQEFRIEISAEAKGVITLEFKVFGNLTRKLFGSGERVIAITEASSKTPP